MADIFVSYKREDRPRVEPIVALLEAKGWTVWYDRRLIGGESWNAAIRRELRAARCVVVGWSIRSIDPRAGQYVLAEAHWGLSKNKPVIGALLERVGLPVPFNTIQCVDLVGWRGQPDTPSAVALVRAIGHKLPRRRLPPPAVAGSVSLSCTRTGTTWTITAAQLTRGREVMLGRGTACDIEVLDPTVSRIQASLSSSPQAGPLIRDLNSANGTFLDGKRIGTEPQPISGARTLRLGNWEASIHLR
jgi:TIR domain/FHA domain